MCRENVLFLVFLLSFYTVSRTLYSLLKYIEFWGRGSCKFGAVSLELRGFRLREFFPRVWAEIEKKRE